MKGLVHEAEYQTAVRLDLPTYYIIFYKSNLKENDQVLRN
jgi:hypothetical protein